MNIFSNTNAPILCVMGVTATGKTDLAIGLASHIPCEIISADSAMVYRGLNIGTAKPSPLERQNVKHHLIDVCDVNDIYTAGQFCNDARTLVGEIHARGKIPLIVGGTMLYFHLFQKGMANLPPKNDEIRTQLVEQAQKKGWSILHQMLEKIDPTTASKLHPNDIQRIQRALEIYYVSGELPSKLYAQQESFPAPNCHSIILLPLSSTEFQQNIQTRFTKMLDDGLVDEVKGFYKNYAGSLDHLPAFRTVGYRQVLDHLNGVYDYETMIEKALQATRHLAKHQLTWLKRWKGAPTFTKTNTPTLVENVLHWFKTIEKNREK
jgi:tRNA dimethylallyltransferase